MSYITYATLEAGNTRSNNNIIYVAVRRLNGMLNELNIQYGAQQMKRHTNVDESDQKRMQRWVNNVTINDRQRSGVQAQQQHKDGGQRSGVQAQQQHKWNRKKHFYFLQC